MKKEGSQLLYRPISLSFNVLDRENKLALLGSENISLVSGELGGGRNVRYADEIRKLGFTPVMIDDVFTALAFYVSLGKVTLPLGKKQKEKRGGLVRDILESMDFVPVSTSCHMNILTTLDRGKVDLLAGYSSLEDTTEVDQLKAAMIADSMTFGQVLGRLKKLVAGQNGLVVTESAPGQILEDGLKLLISAGDSRKKYAANIDHIIPSDKPGVINFGALRESVRHARYSVRRRELEAAIQSRDITLVPKFTLNNWPHDPLMQRLRTNVSLLTSDYIKSKGIVCDPQDLKYQVLFRLTTFEVSDVFEDGAELERHLRSVGVYTDWRNVFRIDSDLVNQFTVNKDLVKQIIEEQAVVILDRLKKSDLPLDELLTRKGIFSRTGYVIQKRDSALFAVVEEGFTALEEAVPLEFREVDPELAIKFHRDLHYIHTPRATLAFGLFIKGEDIPFSVLALDRIDRPYKQNVLLIQGYDPRKCFDLTRLWSKPGTPGNTSSGMFSLTFKYLRKHYPQIQAILSAFMPSYATGVSMTSGGFDNPVMVKPLSHAFMEREIEGRAVYENLTRRRQEIERGRIIRSKFPLLPTIELIAPLQPPRFAPLTGAAAFMAEIH